ncbi:hypothetical protein DFH08DRAFT_863121 [Mycena albidolilacea]|uniref:F-box domain-containing protein n=1 Tax=Mycena albidolilacea TaxID=1033008 RepID=A0AAD7ESL8_9AGAR|nr:hypothetical protein DFH08DRAFT_863121 [Mycena albidolilacea]
MKVEELPQDVLLEIAQWLNVRDLLAFISTCRVIRQLRFQRSFWLEALIRIREIESQPLPLSNADPLETLSLSELQSVARRADRLKKNWQSNTPRLVHIHSFFVPSQARIMLIPGAHLAVAYASGIVSCWDILSSHRVAHLEIPGLIVRAEQLCMDINGQVLIGASINGRPRNLVVVCIDFRDRAHISVSHVVSPAVGGGDLRPSGPFIDRRGMGFIDRTRIVFWCMDPDVAVQTTSQPLKRTFKARCLPLGQNIYVLGYMRNWNGIVQTIPHPVSNSDRTAIHPASSTALLGIPVDHRVWTSMVERGPQVFAPHYGIFAVTSRSFADADSLAWHRTVIHFRPGRTIRDELELGEGCVYEHNQPVSQVAVGTSGTYVALFFARRPSQDHENYLGLVHCDVTATPVPQATFRMLDVGDVELRSCVRVALDDALGLVSLVDQEGEVTVLSYV